MMLVQAASSHLQTVLLIFHFLSSCATSFPPAFAFALALRTLPPLWINGTATAVSLHTGCAVCSRSSSSSEYHRKPTQCPVGIVLLDTVADQKHAGQIPDCPAAV